MDICICGKTFEKKVWNQKYCSFECKETARYKDVPCKTCGKVFSTKKKSARYCSMICASISRGERVEYFCNCCGVRFLEKKSKSTYGYSKYCSKVCANKGLRKPVWISCKECGILVETFVIDDSSVKKRKFCSGACKRSYFNYNLDEVLIVKMYVEEQLPARVIAERLGTNDKQIYKALRNQGIERRDSGYGARYTTETGIEVRSSYEKIFADKLTQNGINYEYETRISKDARFFTDFKIADIYVEIWGMEGVDFYDAKTSRKREFYLEKQLRLVDVYPKDFKNIDLKVEEVKSLLS